MKYVNYLIKLNVSITLYEYCTHNLAPVNVINLWTDTHTWDRDGFESKLSQNEESFILNLK